MVLVFGASYGLIICAKLMMAGYDVKCICLEKEAEILNNEGFKIEIPGYLRKKIFINSNNLKGNFSAFTPDKIKSLNNIKLAFLAMQESQYSNKDILKILEQIIAKPIPSVSIMNIPPSSYLKKFININDTVLNSIYFNHKIWKNFNIDFLSHASADPQIFKPEVNTPNFISVRLASNFRVASFQDSASEKILEEVAKKIKNARLSSGSDKIRVPINLNIYKSPHISLSKLPMLITGNYRCVVNSGIVSIKNAVMSNINVSKKIYDDVYNLCLSLGASKDLLIPFDGYLKAAQNLTAPSSVARAFLNGDPNIERVDKLVLNIAKLKNLSVYKLEEIVKVFDNQLK